ncbi:helix-turn-helix transcriptional regulator [Streptomyces antimicrobicus]|uniref:WYL domain-containing protein n=1 Tax=Streptomyces antimicrobicus TaxID=2883108 RepID=A0ABS8B5E3_9ACTN|nr:WYL domain-containing protein [Streptomyces antimicrobicus]MCB5179808.1 WYL domain-containing protein [Streptomyces antimicrobicus]
MRTALALLAVACRDREIVTFTYRRGSGETGRRHAEPHALVCAAPAWYLVAYDTNPTKGAFFRVDRLTDPTPSGRRLTPASYPPATPPPTSPNASPPPARYALHATVRAT